MNKNKQSNPVRLIAFFLTGVILICTFGFTVDGWQSADKAQGQESPQVNGKPDENIMSPENNESGTENTPEEPEIYIPAYTNRLTGLECSEEIAAKTHLAFIMNADADCYGIGGADILCEIPTENDGHRLVAIFSNTDNLWKIGALAPTRDYISNIACYFGGVTISVGNDDQMRYDACSFGGQTIDLSSKNGYHYTEFSEFSYTNCDLVNALTAQTDNVNVINTALPFDFSDFGSEPILGTEAAKNLSVNTSYDNRTEFVFNEDSSTYSIHKNGKAFCDALNGEILEFTNCFILFADSVTYDNVECSQMVMDTVGSGVGYYVTNGTLTKIKWSATTAGVMTFYNEAGEKLTINRGSSYIYYLKSSKIDNVTLS